MFQFRQNKKPVLRRFLVPFVFAVAFFAVGLLIVPNPASAEDRTVVYAIGDNNGFLQYPVLAYLIHDQELIEADTLWMEMGAQGGPVGILADPENKRVYLAHHHYNELAQIHAETFEPLGMATFLEAHDLAGMDIDLENGLLYVANREGHEVFVYNASDLTIVDTWTLTNCGGAFGIAVHDGIMYVGDGSNTVHYYDVGDGSELGSYETTDPSVATALKGSQYAFTTMGRASNSLMRYDLANEVESVLELGGIAKGVTVNPDAGLVYVLTGFGDLSDTGIRVVNGETMTELAFYPFGDGNWSPTDVTATYGDFGRSISIQTISHPEGVVPAGDEVTFRISFTNYFETSIKTLPVEFIYDETALEFVSSDPPMDEGTVGWTDLSEAFGGDLAPEAAFTVDVTFKAAALEGATSLIVKSADAVDEADNELSGTAGRKAIEVGGGQADDDDDDVPADKDDGDDSEGACGC